MTTHFDENPSSSEYQLGSIIQGSSREAKERRGETDRGRRS